jgi:hypothetical protein
MLLLLLLHRSCSLLLLLPNRSYCLLMLLLMLSLANGSKCWTLPDRAASRSSQMR